MITVRNHLPATGPISRDEFDAIGDHTHELEDEDIQEFLPEQVAAINYFRNADFSLWTRGTTAVSLSEGIRTQRADFWFARADYGALGSGGGGTFAAYEQAEDDAHQQWLYCAKLTGSTNITKLDLGQEIPARVAAALHPKAVLTLEVENQTGAALTPVVRVDTCDTFESYNAVTNRVNQAVDSAVNNAERKTWEVVLDLNAFGDFLRNGALIYVRFPSVNGPAKFVKVFAAKLEIGEEATDRITERDTQDLNSDSASSGGSSERQFFRNSNLGRWLSSEKTCEEDLDNYAADAWFVQPSDGDTLAYNRSTIAPDDDSLYSAQLVGEAAVTGTVDFGQNLPAVLAAEARRTVTFSAMIFNDTGAAIAPSLRIDTCDSTNSFTDVTNRASQELAVCADGAWTLVNFTFDGGSLTNFANGARIYIRFPSGSLASVNSLNIARPRLTNGADVSTFLPEPDRDAPAETARVRTLRIAPTSSVIIGATFDEAVIGDGSGRLVRMAGQSLSLDITTQGAGGLDYAPPATLDTWHHLYLISSGAAHALIASKTDVPDLTLPAGYDARLYLGSFRTKADSTVPDFLQIDAKIWHEYAADPIADTNPTSDDVFQAIDLSAYIPKNARTVFGIAGIKSAHDCKLILAAGAADFVSTGLDGDYPQVIIGPVAATGYGLTTGTWRFTNPFEIPLTEEQEICWKVETRATRQYRIHVSGFTV